MATIEVDVQRDATGLKGVLNNSIDNGWSGTDKHLPIGRWINDFPDPNETYKTRSLVKFQIPFATTWTGITSATLHLKQRPRNPASNEHGTPGAGTSLSVLVRRMVRDWWEGDNNGEWLWTEQSQLGWERKCVQVTDSGITNWTENDGVTHNFTQSDSAVEDIVITGIVTKWFEDFQGSRTAPNYGVILINGDEENDNKSFDFLAKEQGSGDWPTLTIVYTTGTEPPPPGDPEDSPDGTITSPTNGGTVDVLTPTITWDYDDPNAKAQESAWIRIYDAVTAALIYSNRQYGTSQTHDIPSTANLSNGKEYNLEVKVRNVDLIADPTPDTNTFDVDLSGGEGSGSTNPPITGLVASANEELGYIVLNWNVATIDNGTFKCYNIYRKRHVDPAWQLLDTVTDINTPSYSDWSAGNGILYDYRLTSVATITEES